MNHSHLMCTFGIRIRILEPYIQEPYTQGSLPYIDPDRAMLDIYVDTSVNNQEIDPRLKGILFSILQRQHSHFRLKIFMLKIELVTQIQKCLYFVISSFPYLMQHPCKISNASANPVLLLLQNVSFQIL